MSREPSVITTLLNRAAAGDRDAGEQVFSEVYGELRRLAAIQRRRLRPHETLATTALVHEAYLRMMGKERPDWTGRNHFYCTAARSMRDILVEDARRRLRIKRGGDQNRVDLDQVEGELTTASPEEVLELDEALRRLEAEMPEDYQMVMLRYFTGLTMEEAAEVLDTPLRTLQRRWRFCRAWLRKELGGTEPEA